MNIENFDRRMNIPQGSILKEFVWRFTDRVDNPSYKDFFLEPFDTGYMITCILFIILGSCGIFLNARAVYLFFQSKTVSVFKVISVIKFILLLCIFISLFILNL